MATNVIHGVGKPRIAVTESAIHTNAVGSSSSTSVTLKTGADLAGLELNYGLTGRMIYTFNNADDETIGIITGYSESPDILQVASWSNGNPDTDKALEIKNIRIDLPYCQQLTESFRPDFLTTKMLDGRILLKKRGFYYAAQLDYTGFMSKTTLSLLRHLYTTRDKILTFYPRVDNLKVAYNVDIDSAEILFAQIQKFQGHKGVQVNFIGIERLAEAQIYDLLGTTGYGVNYGTNYGASF